MSAMLFVKLSESLCSRSQIASSIVPRSLVQTDSQPPYDEHRRSLPTRQPPVPPKPPIAPAKANRIAAWSMGVQPVEDEPNVPPYAPPPARRPKSTYLEYDYTQPPPPPPQGEVDDGPRLLKSAMKGSRARVKAAPESESSLDGIIDPFQPSTVAMDAAMHYGSWHPK